MATNTTGTPLLGQGNLGYSRPERPRHTSPRVVQSAGWAYSPGLLTWGPYGLKRLSEDELRSMFLPRRTRAAITMMHRYAGDSLVRAQFAHYGLEYDASTTGPRGTTAIQEALFRGRMSRVSDEVQALEEGLRDAWMQAYGYAQFYLDMHFLTNGVPDRAKSPEGVRIVFHCTKTPQARELIEAARAIGVSATTCAYNCGAILYLGWDLQQCIDQSAAEADRMVTEVPERAEDAIALGL